MERRALLKYSLSGLLATPALSSVVRDSLVDRSEDTSDFLSSSDNDEDYWELVKKEFDFAPGLVYFNNASLGPCPKLVVDATNHYRALLDGFPSKYMWGAWQEDKEQTRAKVAEMFSCDKEEIALTHNTTEGMNVIAASMNLKEGDEVILANHEHTSGTACWQYWQEEAHGVKLVRPKLPILPKSKEEIVEVYRRAMTPRTKVISMVHGTNTNGMIMPVKEISKMAHERGVLVAVDGAQTAGTFKIDFNDLECDFYAASAHKFMFGPKGTAVFYARKESQKHLKSLIVSRGWKDKSIRRLENYNTRNLPEMLGQGMAVDYYNLIGAEKREARMRDLKTYFRGALAKDDRFVFKTPVHDELSCAIQNVEVVGKKVGSVKQTLSDEYGIDCRPMSSHGLNGLRISLSVFTTKKDVDYLVDALKKV